MRFIYYATFVSGLQCIIEQVVKNRLKDIRVKKLLDGAVIFETACSYDKLNLFCFNNIFMVLDIFDIKNEKNGIVSHVKRVCQQKDSIFANPRTHKSIHSFRVITSYTNQLVPLNEKIKWNIEHVIAQKTKLLCNRSKPDTEYWFLYRNEGFSVFMERLTKHKSFDKTLHKGELQPQLAYLMCWMSHPDKSDIVLDPFCGYGSILEQRLKHFPIQNIYGFDIKREAVAISLNKIKGKLLQPCTIKKLDIYTIFSVLSEKSIDKIITDPPWGMYEQLNMPIQQFYNDMMHIFCRLVKHNGSIILLTSKKEELIAAVSTVQKLVIIDSIHILVSGKKACIFHLKKMETAIE
jgi:tRNA G10  N-methylase Trm11